MPYLKKPNVFMYLCLYVCSFICLFIFFYYNFCFLDSTDIEIYRKFSVNLRPCNVRTDFESKQHSLYLKLYKKMYQAKHHHELNVHDVHLVQVSSGYKIMANKIG